MKRFTLLLVLILLSLSVYVLLRCNKSKDPQTAKAEKANTQKSGSFVRPPITEADIPYSHYTINAESGGTIEHPSGSTIVFPANAFVDANGKIITGKVDVRYREFPDPAAMIFSGIPMRYDSAGKTYQFESSGMCDIRADQNGKGLGVNPKRKPTINMVSANADESYNLYVLDTTSGKWIPKGKPVVFVPQQTKVTIESPLPVARETPLIIPEKPKGNMPIVQVLIDKSSFKELGVYDNMRFQIDENEKSFNPQDADVEWEDVSLNRTKNVGQYRIIFKKGEKKVKYAVHPVFEGKDYNVALKKFQGLLALQQKNDADRKKKLANDETAYIAMEKSNAQIEKENKIIAAKNKIIEQKNREAIEKKERMEKQNELINTKNNEVRLKKALYNSFQVTNFGFWNCDCPLYDLMVNTVSYNVELLNKKSEPIAINTIYCIYDSINTAVFDPSPSILNYNPTLRQSLIITCRNLVGYVSPEVVDAAIRNKVGNNIRLIPEFQSFDNQTAYEQFIRSKRSL
jgi:hypothetical protein